MNRILALLAGCVFLNIAIVCELAAADEEAVQITRIYADTDGITHFEEIEMALTEVDFAPPAPPVLLSDHIRAEQWSFFAIPPGWEGDWHPTPARQYFFYLSGQTGIEVGDGTTRFFGTGDILLVEDTTGKGHRSWTVGDVTSLQVVVPLPVDEEND
jgi:quercetin dioxygenase-like cupin family protein